MAVGSQVGDEPITIFTCNTEGYVPPVAKEIVVNSLPKEYAVFGENEVRFTIPVTSPTPTVVAVELIVSVLTVVPLSISRLPLVVDGLALCKWRMPFIVKSLVAVIPPLPLIVKLLTFPAKIDVGRVIADELVKAKVALALLASIFPLVLVGELPAMVKVFAAMVNVPEIKSSNPLTVIF